MPKNFIVYEHLFPNGKRYIGITSKKPQVRWGSQGKGYQRYQNLVYRAILKYGWDNVEHNILYTGLSEAQAKKKEIELIAKYDTTNAQLGYNLTKGGDGTLGLPYSEERRKKQSAKMKGRFDGGNNSQARPVYQYDLDGNFIKSFPCAVDAAKELGIGRVNISSAANGKKNKSAGRYQWRFEYVEKIAPYKKKRDRRWSEVWQYDLEGNFIKAYDTAVEAAKATGLNSGHICSCRCGLMKSTGGYLWTKANTQPPKYEKKYFVKQVAQYDMEGNLINIYKSAVEAAKCTGVSRAGICQCRSGTKKSCGGYIWKHYHNI